MFGQERALHRRLGKIIPAALLAACIALVIVHFVKAITHEITLFIVLSDDFVDEQSVLKLQVTGPDQQMNNAAYVIFRLDPRTSTYRHVLHLGSGAYNLSFQYSSKERKPFIMKRDLDVTADEMVRIHIP